MTITYIINNKLYVNLTNRCTNNCIFCVRNSEKGIGYNLWLDFEPSKELILEDILKHDLTCYEELVFCGYGEPLFRIYDILEICKIIKEKSNIIIRVNTNGHLFLIYNDRTVLKKMEGLIDTLSISLNAKNSKEYTEICRCYYGESGFYSLIDFTKAAKPYVKKIILSVVSSYKDVDLCKNIAENLGVEFRLRELID